MSETEGLAKLTEYLNNTRRQAELSINVLNDKINELINENNLIQNHLIEVINERDYYKNLAEQLKRENTNKYKLQERDDWKSLVESLQNDRSRLQQECIKLQEEIEKLTTNNNNHHIHSPSFEHKNISNDEISSPDTPSSIVRKLRMQLDEAKLELEVHKKSSISDNEIKALQEELTYYRQQSKINKSNQIIKSNIRINKVNNQIVSTNNSLSWINPLNMVTSYFNSNSNSNIYNNKDNSSILHV